MRERLQKILAEAGIASRRAAERMILEGRVSVNGAVVQVMGVQADLETDSIEVDGKQLMAHEQLEYYAVNKPVNVLSTVSDDEGRATIISLVKSKVRLYPVGRLDMDSHGLIFLTNDGDFAYRLTHPKFEHQKTYAVTATRGVQAELDDNEMIERLRLGVKLPEGIARADSAKLITPMNTLGSAIFEITIHQGWKRQVRRMFEVCGWQVTDLCRTKIGSVELGDLALGTSRVVTQTEIDSFISSQLLYPRARTPQLRRRS